MKTGHFFSKLDSKRIVDAIGRAEAGTSGEIRVHVTRHEPQDIEARARERFQKLGMTKTLLREAFDINNHWMSLAWQRPMRTAATKLAMHSCTTPPACAS